MRRKTNEQFIDEVKKNHPRLLVLDNYKNVRTKVSLKCIDCNQTFKATPASLYMKHGCPYCSGTAKKTTNQFAEEMQERNPSIEIIGEYVNSKTPIESRCKVCGHIWNPTPNSLQQGKGCPECSGLKRKTQEQFILEMEQLHPTIIVVGQYKNNRTKVKCKCTQCNEYFHGVPHAMIDGGNGCPNCTTSRGENRIKEWLKSHNIVYECQHIFKKCKDKRVLPFDFYLPHENVVIEYDGIQHFKISEFFGGIDSFEKLKLHDEIKTEYCKSHGIRLLRIPYLDYDNIETILENELVK